MSTLGNSSFSPSVFLLTGIPELEGAHSWLAILFCAMYIIAILGNSTILFVIQTEQSLHEPMYLFLSMLAVTDLGLSLSTLPTVLSIFWFNFRQIYFDACLIQMFFIHSLSIIESAVLLAMAFDRFIAISYPLRYASILTNPRITKTGIAIVIRATAILTPLIIRLKLLPYCGTNVLSHSYCLHQDVMKHACKGTTMFNIMYGLAVALCTMTVDGFLIVLSYIMIIKTVLGIASERERLKALNTCVSHICAVLIFYIPMIGLSMIHRFGKHAAPFVPMLMANVYLFVPPVLNPIIYSIKTKQIRLGIYKLLLRKGVGSAH
ncbi:olfactory receptor 51G2-like [Microcaecilia unicolor]|uniref:Olfactory receptor n=1 Tax=Microcaecilia unicolor TaxID=1415580 RepID=A0A6P7XSU5_9AMPH|nr:olfactory receptor 51G2-like [Microcaecilia unicolor]